MPDNYKRIAVALTEEDCKRAEVSKAAFYEWPKYGTLRQELKRQAGRGHTAQALDRQGPTLPRRPSYY